MDTNSNPVPALVLMAVGGTFFLSIGIWFLRTPTEKLLDWDRRTGYWLYRGELDRHGDKNRAIDSAGCLYKFFGFIYVAGCSLYLLIVLALLIGFLTGSIKFQNA